MHSPTIQEYQYTSVLKQYKADGAKFLKNSNISKKDLATCGAILKTHWLEKVGFP